MKKTSRKTLQDEDIIQNTYMYDTYHSKYKMDDGWFPGNKQRNFQYLVKLTEMTGIPLSGASCLDVGCGSGDMSLFLRHRGIRHYLGIDIYTPSLVKARRKYPLETFIEEDFLKTDVKEKFDYVFCSGALTIRLKSINNYDFLEAVIQKMWELSHIGIAFNVLVDTDSYQDPELFFYSEERVVSLVKKITSATVIAEKTPNLDQIHVYAFRDSLQIS